MRDGQMFHQLSLGETLGKTLRIFFGRLDVFMPLALGVTVPMSLTTVLFVASLADVRSDDDVWDYFANHLGTCLSYIVFQTMLYVILFFAVEGAMVRAAAEIYGACLPPEQMTFCFVHASDVAANIHIHFHHHIFSWQIAAMVRLFLSRTQQVWVVALCTLACLVLLCFHGAAGTRTLCGIIGVVVTLGLFLGGGTCHCLSWRSLYRLDDNFDSIPRHYD